MFKHFINQRRINRNLLMIQSLIAIAVSSICYLVATQAHAIAFALGVMIIALAHFVMASLIFVSSVQAAPIWLGRFFLAAMLKWLLVVALILFFAKQLSAAPMTAVLGVIVSLVVIQLFNYFDSRVKRGS
jgi:F0F1-type ATP synthase assembly protein I